MAMRAPCSTQVIGGAEKSEKMRLIFVGNFFFFLVQNGRSTEVEERTNQIKSKRERERERG